jgi:hypothetical protein
LYELICMLIENYLSMTKLLTSPSALGVLFIGPSKRLNDYNAPRA